MLDSHPHHAEAKPETSASGINPPSRPNRSRLIAIVAVLVAVGDSHHRHSVAPPPGKRSREMDDGACGADRCHGHAETGRYGSAGFAARRYRGLVSRRRSMRGSAAISRPGISISARMSRRASCWRKSMRPISTPNLPPRKQGWLRPKPRSRCREAERNFAETTYARWRDSPKGVVSEQETESKKAESGSADARYKASLAEANVNQSQVDQLTALEAFKRIVAPFDGIVTVTQHRRRRADQCRQRRQRRAAAFSSCRCA